MQPVFTIGKTVFVPGIEELLRSVYYYNSVENYLFITVVDNYPCMMKGNSEEKTITHVLVLSTRWKYLLKHIVLLDISVIN